MKIYWGVRGDGDRELVINNVLMGWVDGEHHVHCMWMTFQAEKDGRPQLIETQYPEDHDFETVEQAKEALLESAIVVYVGGFRGR